MVTDRKTLLDILGVISPAVSKREIIIQQTHAIFTGKEVCGINGNVLFRHPFPSDFKGSVKFTDIQKLLASSKAEAVNIDVVEGKFCIKGSDVKAKLNSVIDEKDKVESQIDLMVQEMVDWKLLPEDFADALYMTAFSASRNMTEGVITAVFVEDMHITTTDKNRASWYQMKSGVGDNFLLAASDALLVSGYELAEYCYSDRWIHFKTPQGATFSARKLAGSFLPIRQQFEGMKTQGALNLPDYLVEAVGAASIMVENASSDPSQVIRVLLEPGVMKPIS